MLGHKFHMDTGTHRQMQAKIILGKKLAVSSYFMLWIWKYPAATQASCYINNFCVIKPGVDNDTMNIRVSYYHDTYKQKYLITYVTHTMHWGTKIGVSPFQISMG